MLGEAVRPGGVSGSAAGGGGVQSALVEGVYALLTLYDVDGLHRVRFDEFWKPVEGAAHPVQARRPARARPAVLFDVLLAIGPVNTDGFIERLALGVPVDVLCPMEAAAYHLAAWLWAAVGWHQLAERDAQGLADRLRRAPGKALKDDAAVLALAHGQTRRLIRVGGALHEVLPVRPPPGVGEVARGKLVYTVDRFSYGCILCSRQAHRSVLGGRGVRHHSSAIAL